MLNIDHAEVESCARAVAANPEFCLGVKVRESVNVVGENGLEPLRRALQAAELAGPWAKVMCHIGDAPGDLAELMGHLREGDVVTHAYSGAGNNIVQEGKLLDSVRDARERGVRFGVGHGRRRLRLHRRPARDRAGARTGLHIERPSTCSRATPPVSPYLPNVMSKFLALGALARGRHREGVPRARSGDRSRAPR